MTDPEHAERIGKLEQQTGELQQQVKELLKRQNKQGFKAKRNEKTPANALRDALNSDVMQNAFVLLFWAAAGPPILVILAPWFIDLQGLLLSPLFGLPSSPTPALPVSELIELIPGGKAVWIPLWWAAVFLTALAGAVMFIFSPWRGE
jgi:uncharacterized protein (UPF0335 family)